jgi:hypothetical protein
MGKRSSFTWDLSVRIGLQVEEPGGRLIGAALRGDDQEVVAMRLEDQRV